MFDLLADADVSCASGASRASIGRASIGRASIGRASIGRPSIGRMSIEPSVSCVSAVSVEDSRCLTGFRIQAL